MSIICNEVIEKWEESGADIIIEHFRSDDIDAVCLEFVDNIMDGKLTGEQLVAVLQLPLSETHMRSIINVLWICDMDCENKSKRKEFLIDLVNHLVEENVIPEEQLRMKLNIKALQSLGMEDEVKQFKKEKVSFIKESYYRQKKFNLLSEESEGYSKFIFELTTTGVSLDEKIDRIKQIIGHFTLDPNRCLDLLLDAFENNCGDQKTRDEYIQLIQVFPKREFLVKLIRLKFYWYNEKRILEETPNKLFSVVAELLNKQLIKLEEIVGFLHPNDREFQMRWIKLMSQNQRTFKLSKPHFVYPYSQKIKILSELLKSKDYYNSFKLLSIMNPNVISAYKSVYDPLLKYLKEQLEDEEIDFCELLQIISCCSPRLGEIEGLFEKIIRNFVKLLASCEKIEVKEEIEKRYGEDIIQTVLVVILKGLTSLRLTVFEGEKGIELMKLIWEGIFKKVDYRQRFEAYGRFEDSVKDSMALYFRHAKFRKNTSDVMKRVSRENVGRWSRDLRIFIMSNPIASSTVLMQFLFYEVMVETIGSLLSGIQGICTSMVVDVLLFRIFSKINTFSLGEPFQKFHDDLYSESQTLKNYVSFIACQCARMDYIDFQPMVDHLLSHVKLCSWIDLILLRDIIQKASGEDLFDEVKSDRLDFLSGGELLLREVGFGNTKCIAKTPAQRTKNIIRLTKWFSMNSLRGNIIFHELLIELATLLMRVPFIKDEPKFFLKLISKGDRVHETLFLLLSFIKSAEIALKNNNEGGEIKLPTLKMKVLIERKIRPDVIFTLTRRKIEDAVTNGIDVNLTEELNGDDYLMMIPKSLHCNLAAQKVFILFWKLELSDIVFPTVQYERAISEVKKKFEKNKEQTFVGIGSESEKTKRIKVLKDIAQKEINELKTEMLYQQNHTRGVETAIVKILDEIEDNFQIIVGDYLQYMALPRSLLSAKDAIFSAYFLERILEYRPKGKWICDYNNYARRVFKSTPAWLLFCTKTESVRIARFLKYIMRFLKLRVTTRKPYTRNGTKGMNNKEFELFFNGLHEDFSNALTYALMKENLNIHVKKNILLALNEIKGEYPEFQVHAVSVFKSLGKLRGQFTTNVGGEQKEDALYKSYVGFLKKRIHEKKLTKKEEKSSKEEEEEILLRKKLMIEKESMEKEKVVEKEKVPVENVEKKEKENEKPEEKVEEVVEKTKTVEEKEDKKNEQMNETEEIKEKKIDEEGDVIMEDKKEVEEKKITIEEELKIEEKEVEENEKKRKREDDEDEIAMENKPKRRKIQRPSLNEKEIMEEMKD